ALALRPEAVLLSPGPKTPTEAGICLELIKQAPDDLPIFGVCLGHQSIGQAFGGDVVRARQVMHGKTSPVFHEDKGVFEGLNHPLTVTRYHSLIVKRETLPDCLELTAWTQLEDGSVDEIMGLRHKTLNIEGVQFHPESILTEQGHELFANFLKQTGGTR
uniref:anthranilate synthase component II n=1 Tax=Pseudomonas sp. TaxID=306 RepID=UPI00286A056B